ncbi:MAG: sulfite exporter TauE/SafE family protein [Xanthobacteraceae bacterium]|nr:sulfite exporter TauE/SafE family protein [Xanthobacteraceae bacterium]
MSPFDPQFAVAGFIVGALVGLTGVGGGSLMTPILILLFGVAPATAVGTDLLFAAATKTVGSLVHGLNRTIAWRVVLRLAAGSLPATAFALFVLSRLHMSAGGARVVITAILALALLLTAAVLIARDRISARYAARLAGLDEQTVATLTIAMGAVLGILVTFSSVGAGAIGVTALVLLYPRIPMARIVGSDIAHAVPLTLLAGLGHGAMGSLDLHVLVSLLIGSFPGIFVGSWASSRVPDVALRYVLAGVLIIVGARLALNVSLHATPDVARFAIEHVH